MDEHTAKQWLWMFAAQSLDYAILMLGTDGEVRWASIGAAEILGMPATQIVGQSMLRFFTAEDRDLGIPAHEVLVAERQGSSDDDRWMAKADGSSFWASGRTMALRDTQGGLIGFVKIMRNLTEMKMRMTTLRNRAQALAADEEARNSAIATMAHELRNPLASLGMAAAVLRQLPPGTDITQPLDILDRNVGFAARLVGDLEQASRLGLGKLTLAIQSLTLDEQLDIAIKTVMDRHHHAVRNIELLFPHGQQIVFEADALRIQQVFANLIGNAIKFTRPGGKIWINGTAEGANATVRIADDGIGIEPRMLESIFGMFTQAKSPASPAGLGIGLALVKTLVELHGGSVQAYSDGVGKGSEFIVRLPLQQNSTAALPVL